MGPEAAVSGARLLPACPRFSWEIQTVPWTDVVCDQLSYVKAVLRSCQFHDNLDDSDANNIEPANSGLCLLSNFYGRAEDFVATIEDDRPSSDDAVEMIADRIQKRYAMSVTSLVFYEFPKVHNTVHFKSDTFAAFQARFSTQVTRFIGFAPNLATPIR